MKLIVAVIKPFKLDEVRTTLDRLGVKGMTVSEVNGYGRQKGRTEIYRGAEYCRLHAESAPRYRRQRRRGRTDVEAIRTSARTGQIGDGKIFVSDRAGDPDAHRRDRRRGAVGAEFAPAGAARRSLA